MLDLEAIRKAAAEPIEIRRADGKLEGKLPGFCGLMPAVVLEWLAYTAALETALRSVPEWVSDSTCAFRCGGHDRVNCLSAAVRRPPCSFCGHRPTCPRVALAGVWGGAK